jgi:hypothetical protein
MSAVGAKVITPVGVASEPKAEGEQHGSARRNQDALDRIGGGNVHRAATDSYGRCGDCFRVF